MLYLTEIDGDNTLGLGKNVVLAGDVNAGGLSSTYNWRTGGKNGSIDLGFCCLALGVRFALRAMAALPHAWDSANAGRGEGCNAGIGGLRRTHSLFLH